MRIRRHAGLTLAAALVASALGTTPAQAATPSSCRASAARAVLPNLATSEPVVANRALDPCATDNQQVAGIAPVGPISVTAPRATTRASAGVLAAATSIEGATLTLGGAAIGVGAVTAEQTVSCRAGSSTSSGTSRVDTLVIGGTPVNVIAGSSIDLNVGAVRVRTNVVTVDGRQALVLDALGTQVVLGEVRAAGDACTTAPSGGAGGDGGNGGNGSTSGPGRICPTGSVYRVTDNVCVIDRATGRDIVIGAPYSGPSGGTVASLAAARARVQAGALADSRCLHGKGPEYVVMGTSRADRLTGTNHGDRILGVGGNDKIDGGRGGDCIDGGKGTDTLTGGEGADRLLGESGRDHLNGGPQTDTLDGGAGNDTINTGFGADRVYGRAGNDDINASTAGPPARIDGGSGRDKVRLNRNERRRVRHAEIVHALR